MLEYWTMLVVGRQVESRLLLQGGASAQMGGILRQQEKPAGLNCWMGWVSPQWQVEQHRHGPIYFLAVGGAPPQIR